jgi:hypothetical protein
VCSARGPAGRAGDVSGDVSGAPPACCPTPPDAARRGPILRPRWRGGRMAASRSTR